MNENERETAVVFAKIPRRLYAVLLKRKKALGISVTDQIAALIRKSIPSRTRTR